MHNAHSHIVRPVNKSPIWFYAPLIEGEIKYLYLPNDSNDYINIHNVYIILYFVSCNENNMEENIKYNNIIYE